MSIGMAKLFASATPVVTYSVFLTPTVSFNGGLPPGGATSSLVTANVTGGTAPFTFLWTKLSGDPIGISSTTASQVTFNANSSNGGTQTAVYKVTVTDNLSAVVEAEIDVIFNFIL